MLDIPFLIKVKFLVAKGDKHSPLRRLWCRRFAETIGIINKQSPSLKVTNKNMPQSICKMFAHIVFSTKNRADFIHPEIENELFGYIHGIVGNNNANLIITNGTTNHIHLLVLLSKKIDIPSLVGDIKRDSSNWIKKEDSQFSNFLGKEFTEHFRLDSWKLML